jgi:D-sedoheptulose 7-phosphate isomerase
MNKKIAERLKIINKLSKLEHHINEIVAKMMQTISNKGVIYTCGNGGSACDAMHMTAELVGRFKKVRNPINSICINTNVAVITSLSNDFNYNQIFSKQLFHVTDKDLVLFYSTSGTSENIVKCNHNFQKILFTGQKTSPFATTCNVVIHIPSLSTPIIQECHTMLNHIIMETLEGKLK